MRFLIFLTSVYSIIRNYVIYLCHTRNVYVFFQVTFFAGSYIFRKKKESGVHVHFVCTGCEKEGKYMRATAEVHRKDEDEMNDQYKLVDLPDEQEHECFPSGF